MSELNREDIECRKLMRQKQNENGGIPTYVRSENYFQIALCDMALAHLASGEAAEGLAEAVGEGLAKGQLDCVCEDEEQCHGCGPIKRRHAIRDALSAWEAKRGKS